MSACIYRITNSVNGKCYVGQTIQGLERRWCNHCSSAQRDSSYHIHNAIRKYGPDAFTVEVLEETTADQLNDRERYWIAELRPAYNMTDGGEGGRPTDEVRAKMRAAKKGRTLTVEHRKNIGIAGRKIGRRLSDDVKKKIGHVHKGKTLSAEHKAKISEARKGQRITAETKAKMSAAHRNHQKR